MQPEAVKELIERHLPDAQVIANSDGSHVDVVVISPAFDGLSMVAEQRMVYGALGDAITSGAIHAINIKCYTPAEWETARKLQLR